MLEGVPHLDLRLALDISKVCIVYRITLPRKHFPECKAISLHFPKRLLDI